MLELQERISSIMSCLTLEEKVVLTNRFGLEGSKGLTLSDTGKIYGVSRESIRLTEKRALEKLSNCEIESTQYERLLAAILSRR